MAMKTEQYMDLDTGQRALRTAYETLLTASRALLEREGGRDNLHGPVSQMIGGLADSVSAISDLLVEQADAI